VEGGGAAGINYSVTRNFRGIGVAFYGFSRYSQSLNYVNADLNRNDAYTNSIGIFLNKNEPNKCSLQLNMSFAYFDQLSSINPAAPVHYWSQSHSGSLTLYFIRDFEINTDATDTWQEKTSAFTSSTSVLYGVPMLAGISFKTSLCSRPS
jgi:hypothetical protein